MHTVGCAVCTMRDSEGFTHPREINSLEINSTDTHIHTLTCTQEIQEVTCRSTSRVHEGMCVGVSQEVQQEEKKKAMTAKPKKYQTV